MKPEPKQETAAPTPTSSSPQVTSQPPLTEPSHAQSPTEIPTRQLPNTADNEVPPASPSEREPASNYTQKSRILSISESRAHIEQEIRNKPRERNAPRGFQKPPKELIDCLRVVEVPYKTPSGEIKFGKLIVNKDIADKVGSVFEDLLNVEGFYTDKVGNMSEYKWSDDDSMANNNTSCWNYRCRTGNSGKLSWHALGLAIDINPKYNPYVTRRGTTYPSNSPGYKPRTPTSTPGSYDHRAVTAQVVSVFEKYDFKWGGDWSGAKDYQHFELLPEGKRPTDSPSYNKFCGFSY